MRTTHGPTRAAAAALILAALALPACSGEDPDAATGTGADAPPPAAEPQDAARLARRGEQVYRSVCVACHAFDPSQPGSVGPPIAGSSLELLRAKVLRNEYPPGYTPKRDTSAMVALPHLEPDLPALAAYLKEAAEEG